MAAAQRAQKKPTQPELDALTDDEWGALVWEQCKTRGDGKGVWYEGQVSLEFVIPDYPGSTGLSKVNPALSGNVIVELQSLAHGQWRDRRLHTVDGVSEGWTGVRNLVRRARSKAATAEAVAAQQRVTVTDEQLKKARVDLADSVRVALSAGAIASELASALGVSPARIYQLRDGKR